MKKYIFNLCLIFIAGLLLAPSVIAQEDTAETTEFEQRQEERSQRIQALLTANEEQRMERRCKSSQQVITNIADRLNTVYDNRTIQYNNLTARLESLSNRIGSQGLDVTALDASIQETQALIDDFLAMLESQKISVNDAIDIECQDDPEGFKLILEDIRGQRPDLIDASQAINDYVKSDVKTELQNLRALLEASDQTSDSADDSSNATANTDPDTPVSSDIEEQ